MNDVERRARVETLRWVAAELEKQIEDLRQDWVKVLLSAGVRSRIETLRETAVMCRTAATKARTKREGR
jgi:hypothetical protein